MEIKILQFNEFIIPRKPTIAKVNEKENLVFVWESKTACTTPPEIKTSRIIS